MPAERTINGIIYYSVKKNTVCHCVQCEKKIPIITPAYAKGTPDSAEIFCRECIIALSDQYQYEVFGRIAFLEDAPLYVGKIGHTCTLLNDANFPTRTAIFRHNKKAAYLPVSYCHKCNRFFIDKQVYQNNSSILAKYPLIDTITGKPIPGSKNWMVDSAPASTQKTEYPASVIWAYQHPYQGGGCNGK